MGKYEFCPYKPCRHMSGVTQLESFHEWPWPNSILSVFKILIKSLLNLAKMVEQIFLWQISGIIEAKDKRNKHVTHSHINKPKMEFESYLATSFGSLERMLWDVLTCFCFLFLLYFNVLKSEAGSLLMFPQEFQTSDQVGLCRRCLTLSEMTDTFSGGRRFREPHFSF